MHAIELSLKVGYLGNYSHVVLKISNYLHRYVYIHSYFIDLRCPICIISGLGQRIGQVLDLQFYVYVLQIVVCPLYFFFWPLCCLFFFDIKLMFIELEKSLKTPEGVIRSRKSKKDRTYSGQKKKKKMTMIVSFVGGICRVAK